MLPAPDTLADLDGMTLIVDAVGDPWARFLVPWTPATAEQPHGLDYPLTLHGPDGERPARLELPLEGETLQRRARFE